MIEPLLRQMELQGFQNSDFDFLLALAKHPRLPLREAMLLAHQLGKLALNDKFYGRLAAVPFLLLLHRFHGDPTALAYVEKYIKVALSLFMRAAGPVVGSPVAADGGNGSVQFLSSPPPPGGGGGGGGGGGSEGAKDAGHTTRSLALEVVAKIVRSCCCCCLGLWTLFLSVEKLCSSILQLT